MFKTHTWLDYCTERIDRNYAGRIDRRSIDIPIDLVLFADEYELEEIFYNLITNSIRAIIKQHKRPDKYGSIEITAKRHKERIIIQVKDNGIGIDKRDIVDIAIKKGQLPQGSVDKMSEEQLLQLIFEDWFSTRKGGGEGLGIVRRDVERYNGQIKVESEYGKGTIFTISLPTTCPKALWSSSHRWDCYNRTA